MRRFFVKNLLFVLAVNLLVKPVWVFMIDRTVQNRVGHAAYGTYQALFNLGLIFQILLDFGLSYYNTRIIAQNPEKLKTMFPGLLSTRLLLILFYTTLVVVLGFVVGYSSAELVLLSGILMIQALSFLLQFLRSNVAALHHFRTDGVLSVTDRLLMILVCGYLLFAPSVREQFKIEWFVVSQILCYLGAVIIAFIVLGKISGLKLRFAFDSNAILPVIKASLPYALLVFLMAVHMRSDTILVERLCGAEGKNQAGIYAAGYRLLDVGNMFGLMFAGMLLPMFGRMLAEKKDVRPIIKLCVNIMLPVAFTLAVGAFFFGNHIMQALYTHATEHDGLVFAWLMATFPAYCMMYVYSTLLTANGNIRLLTKIAFAGVLINLSLNFILIPTYFALGAAFAAFITQSTLSACFMLFSSKHLGIGKSMKWIAAHAGFLLFTIVIGYGIYLLNLNWKLQLAILGVTAGIAMFIFRFITLGALKQLAAKN